MELQSEEVVMSNNSVKHMPHSLGTNINHAQWIISSQKHGPNDVQQATGVGKHLLLL